MQKSLLLISFFCWLIPATAAIDIYEFDDPEQEAQFSELLDQLRCPKCQNQNLSGSNSPIAADLRRELYELLQQGKADIEIVNFMVDRYGEFVLYRPRVSQLTYVLWFGPAILILFGIIIVIVIVRRKPVPKEALLLTKAQQEKLNSLTKNK